jgi:hypothetical protein
MGPSKNSNDHLDFKIGADFFWQVAHQLQKRTLHYLVGYFRMLYKLLSYLNDEEIVSGWLKYNPNIRVNKFAKTIRIVGTPPTWLCRICLTINIFRYRISIHSISIHKEIDNVSPAWHFISSLLFLISYEKTINGIVV